MLETLTKQLVGKEELSSAEITRAVQALVDASVSAEVKADFLIALNKKGESVEELAAFAREMRDRAVAVPIPRSLRDQEIVDVCGTGGDRMDTFNISTTVALLLASAEVVVAKHGNRAITSRSGSADLLEALGIPVDLSPEEAAESLVEEGFAFFLAPRYHPAAAQVGPARKIAAARGMRTIFNYLGPLLNPVHPSAQLIGVPAPELCGPVALVAQRLGVRRCFVVTGRVADKYLDELSILGENSVAEFYQDRGFNVSTLDPAKFGYAGGTITDLKGGTVEENAGITLAILGGKEKGPRLDAVLFNAGAALFVAGKSTSISEGIDLAVATIEAGKPLEKLERLRSRNKS